MASQFRPILLWAGGLCTIGMSGCHRGPERIAKGLQEKVTSPPVFAPTVPSMPQESLPLSHWTREERKSHLLDMMRKRVWGRRVSAARIRRIVTELGPLVREAAQQEAVLPYLQQIAQDDHQTLDEARETWIALQEADLLLEAGGDPDDISPAGAVGRGAMDAFDRPEHGLKVNLAEFPPPDGAHQRPELAYRVARLPMPQRRRSERAR